MSNDPIADMGKADNAVWQAMMEITGSEFAYEINRTPSAMTRDGLGRGFSVEAMDTLVQHMVSFIGTRISRYYERTDVMPQQLAVRIRVALNHQSSDFDETLQTSEDSTVRIDVGRDE